MFYSQSTDLPVLRGRRCVRALRETPFPLVIYIAGLQGDEVGFKVKQTTPLQRVFDAYANRKGVAVDSIRFTFKGSRVHGGQTASSVGMADGDRLDVEDAVAATEPED